MERPGPGLGGHPAVPGQAELVGGDRGAQPLLVIEAGLIPGPRHVVDCPWEFPDETTLLRGTLSAGPAVRAIEHSGEAAAREAVLTACAPFQRADGSYRMACSFHHLTCAV